MTKQEMIDILLDSIETSDSVSGEYVMIRKSDAIRLVHLLAGQEEVKRPSKVPEGQKLFYCADCSKSFTSVPDEDPECFEKWHYHTWFAQCPRCKRRVTLNDRYWR